MKCSVEGIMYPVDARSLILSSVSSNSGNRSWDSYLEVPHASWETLGSVFSFEVDAAVRQVFVLAPLHKGPVCIEDMGSVFAPSDGELCGSDWRVPLSVPSMASLAIYEFIAIYNRYFWPLLVVDKDRMRTIQLGMAYLEGGENGKRGMRESTGVVILAALKEETPCICFCYAMSTL